MKWEAWLLLVDQLLGFTIATRYRWFRRDAAMRIVQRPPKLGSWIVVTLLTTVLPIVLILRLGLL